MLSLSSKAQIVTKGKITYERRTNLYKQFDDDRMKKFIKEENKIKVDKQTGIITDAKFKTYGCGSAIASSSLVTEWVKGKTLDEAATLKNSTIAEHLALPPVKIHCSILAEDAIKAAVEDYKKRH